MYDVTKMSQAEITECSNALGALEVWPESHWPGFALRQADVFQSYAV